MKTLKGKTITIFSIGLLAIVLITFIGCSAVGTKTGSHHEKRTVSTH